MKKAIFVDAALVTTPQEDESKEVVEAWLQNLQMWLQEALYGHFQWLHCVQASNLLTEHMRFPSFDVLRSWQRKYRLDINPALLVTLTDQGVGWRMHYWRIPGEKNIIEFANVLKKSDSEEIY